MDTVEAEGTAIAALTLVQFLFWNEIDSGRLPPEKAIDLLSVGIAANGLGEPGNQKAALLLQTVLDTLTRQQKFAAH